MHCTDYKYISCLCSIPVFLVYVPYTLKSFCELSTNKYLLICLNIYSKKTVHENNIRKIILGKSNKRTRKMSRASTRFDSKKVNSELLTLTYGALVAQMVKDSENTEDVCKQLERLGYNMGVRLIEDFLAKTGTGRCMDLKDTADKIQSAFKMYLGLQPNVSNWSPAGDEFSFLLDSNPLTDLVELPEELKNLKYCNVICGAIRGALEMVQLDVQSWIIQDQLKGDQCTEIRVKFIRRLEDALPAGED